MMTRRIVPMLMLSLLAAACGSSAPPGGAPTDPQGQTVVLWHSAEGDVARALLAQVDRFNASNPWGILVVPEQRGSPAVLASAVRDAIGTGRTPDLILGDPIDTTWLGDAVAPVEPYIADAQHGLSQADLADIYPAALDANRDPRRGNALVGFPVGVDGVVLVYNADRLAAAGYLTPPNSWALLREVCLVTTVDRNGDREPDVYGLGFAPRPEFISAWFRSRGTPLLTADGGAPGFAGDDGLKLFETLSELARGGCFDPTPGPADDVKAFAGGRVAMIFANASELRDIEAAVKQRGSFLWGVAPVPNGKLPVTLDVRGPSWIILRGTPEKQLAAWLFARWFAGTEQTLAWAQASGQLPLRASAADRLAQQYADSPAYAATLQLLEYGVAEPMVPYWPQAVDAVTRSVQGVVAGDPPAFAQGQALTLVKDLTAR